MYIFQPDRFLLDEHVKKFSNYLSGRMLDVGAGSVSRYKKYFTYDEYLKLDCFEHENIDVVADILNIPFDNNSFDSIICTQVFEHIKDPFSAATEFHRTLKHGGRVLITVPQVNELHEEPDDYFRYTKYGLKSIFESVGYREICHERRGGFYTTKAQMEIRYLIDKYDLYEKKCLGKIASFIFKKYGFRCIKKDRKDINPANKKHCIGWLFIFEKT